MSRPNEMSEQSCAVKIVGEPFDPAAAFEGSPIPVRARFLVEMGREILIVCLDILRAIGMSEELEECVVAGQMLNGGQLQTIERDVGPIEIDGGDVGRCVRQIAQDIAAARSDGHDTAVCVEFQGLQIDNRIFPDLGIDETAERERESALP